MAASIRSIDTASNTGSSATISLTTTASPAAQVGDVLVIIHSNDFYALSNMATPTVTGSPTVTEVTAAQGDGGSNLAHQRVYTAVVNTGGQQTVSITETGAGDEEKCLAVYVLTGVDTATPIDGAAANIGGTATTSQVAPAISPGTSDALMLSSVVAQSQKPTYTDPGTMTPRYHATDGTFMSTEGASQALSASGSTGTRTFTASASSTYVAMSIGIRAASGATAAFPPQRPRPRTPVVPLGRRGRIAQTVPPQFNPPYPFTEVVQPRRARGWLLRRGKTPVPVPRQFNPPYPWAEVVQPRRLRGLLPRRGRLATPVPAQVILTPPPYPPQTLRARTRLLRWFRGREAQPVPAQVTFTNPSFVPDRPHRTRLVGAIRRGHAILPPAADQLPPQVRGRRWPAPPMRRTRQQTSAIQEAPVPAGRPPRRILLAKLRRGTAVFPLKQQPPPPNPTFIPTTGRRRALLVVPRRGRYQAIYTCDCRIHRPSSGVTARPNTGVTVDPCC